VNNYQINQRVNDALAQIEAEQKVRVLFACESGSRAWGFASCDSDYDVRFLYIHPHEHYLAVDAKRDVIEIPIAQDLDLSGWELRKALKLLRKSNPPLLEWLKSPIVYRKDKRFALEFNALAGEFYSPRRCFAHYLHMAKGNWRDYVRGRQEVSLKKYLYIFRPLLACRWIERGLGQVPMLFQRLVESVLEEQQVRAELNRLVLRKKAGGELSLGAPLEVLSHFIERELPRLEGLATPTEAEVDVKLLDEFFCRLVTTG
jgi:predicted nucleotidyltransferase